MDGILVSEDNINFDLVFKQLEAIPTLDVVDTLISESTKDELETMKEACLSEQEFMSSISIDQTQLLRTLESAVMSRGRDVYEKISYDQKRIVTFSLKR